VLRRVLVMLLTITGLVALNPDPAAAGAADAGDWRVYRMGLSEACVGPTLQSYSNGTGNPITFSQTVTVSGTVTISASLTGGAEAISATLGFSAGATITISQSVSLAIQPYTVLNITKRNRYETWEIYYSSIFTEQKGRGDSITPIGLCFTTSPTAPPP